MKKRILSIFAVLAVAVNMVGCTPPNTAAPAEVTEQIIVETTAESVEIQEINQLEAKQALTFDEVNRIEINGIEVSLPFKIEDLGEGYSIGEEYGFGQKYNVLYYNSQYTATVDIDNAGNIVSISFAEDSLQNNIIKICELNSSNNFDDIIKTVGSPSHQSDIMLIYEYDNGEVFWGSADGTNGFNFVEISLYGGEENE